MSERGPSDPLRRLGARVDEARARSGTPAGRQGGSPREAIGLGFRISVEFVVAVVVGTGLGWALDRGLGTKPWGTIVLFLLGLGAGMVNVYRTLTGMGMAMGYRQPTNPDRRDDED
jgi:ATP synthase protein I